MAKNTGKYKDSAEAKRNRRILCGDLKLIHDTNLEEANTKYAEGDDAAGKEHLYVSLDASLDGKKFGCKWAQ